MQSIGRGFLRICYNPSMTNRKTNSAIIKTRVRNGRRSRQSISLMGANSTDNLAAYCRPVEPDPRDNRPWSDTLAAEKMDFDNDERFGRYTRDLVHGLETIKQFPQGVTIFGSARFHESNKYYQAAEQLGAGLAKHNHTVLTGGGPGIMEAANKGAYENGGKSVGFNIILRTEQDLNPYTNISMQFNYFFARKVMMTIGSKMYVFFPGGFGTMDEFSEILELVHTGKTPASPIVLYGKEFWQGLDDWFAGKMSEWRLIETGRDDEMSEMSYIKAADFGLVKSARDLYYITDDIDEIVDIADQTIPRNVDDVFDKVMRSQTF